MVAAVNGPFYIAQKDVHPSGAIDAASISPTSGAGLDDGVGITEFTEHAEAGQPVGIDLAVRVEMALPPLGHGSFSEPRQRTDDDAQGPPAHRLRDGGNNRDLVFRTATGLATIPLATKIRIINLNKIMQLPRRLDVGHQLHELVLDPPGGVVRHMQMTNEFQRRKIRLGLRQQVDREEPLRQMQLGALQNRTDDHAGLPASASKQESSVP